MDRLDALHLLLFRILTLKPQSAQAIAALMLQLRVGGLSRLSRERLGDALDQLERAGWLDSGWSETEQAKIYSITEAGRSRLNAQQAANRSRVIEMIRSEAPMSDWSELNFPGSWN